MQRRPLEPIPFESERFRTWDGQILAQLFDYMDSNKPSINNGLFQFDSFYKSFFWLGLRGSPIANKWKKRQAKHPQSAMNGDHPTGYLCWGAKIESKQHVYFEMGDHASIVRFDFKVNKNDQNPIAFVQLDQMRIWDGGNCLDVNCSDPFYEGFINSVRGIISQTVVHLDNNETAQAKEAFKGLSPFIQKLYQWEQQADIQLRQQTIGLK
jgi:hypothetical protein